jgi:nicotinamide mononucleotide transporter
MTIYDWFSRNWIEIFGAITGIIYVFLEIRQNIWLWPVGIITSAVYILVFFTNKFYADMSLQVYYLVISCAGWYWWMKGTGHRTKGERHGAGGMEQGDEHKGFPSSEGLGVGSDGKGPRAQGTRQEEEEMRAGDGENWRQNKNSPFEEGNGDVKLIVTRLKPKTGVILAIIFVILYFLMWFVLSRLTDSPVPEWDSFITSLSIIATWMLARKIYEHWYLWIAVNTASSVIFMIRGLYPTLILYLVYLAMSFVGLKEWKRSL